MPATRPHHRPTLAALLASCLVFACSQPSDTPADAGAGSDGGAQDLGGTGGGDAIAFALDSVAPSRGPLEGGEIIELRGEGFVEGTTVRFGDKAAEVDYRAGSTGLFVVAPPWPIPATVDVRVLRPDGFERVMPGAYTYLDEATVTSFEPDRGPSTGGTVITVRGTGFRPGDRVLVGYREAIETTWVDETTLVAQTPPRPMPGGVDEAPAVVSVRHASGVAHAEAPWTYGRPPRLQRVEPAVLGLAGGPVQLVGEGLAAVDQLYVGGRLATLGATLANDRRLATLAPMNAPGAADALVAGVYGKHVLQPAVGFADPADGPQLLGVVPPVGVSAGGQVVNVLAAWPADATVDDVRFDGTAAAIQALTGALLATTPAHPPGPVPVTVETSAGDAQRDDVFRYAPAPRIDLLKEPTGPATGGDEVRLYGAGFEPACTVRFGTWLGEVTSVEDDGGLLRVIAPPGAPGPVDVQLSCPAGEVIRPDGYDYRPEALRLNAIVPDSGASGGNAQATIYGAGFEKGMQVRFGGKSALQIAVHDSHRATLRTPPHEPGTVTVDVLLGEQSDALLDGYTYYLPTNPQGGTYGGPLDGTLNVTVLDFYTLDPIPQAAVQVGQPGEAGYPQHSGTTDETGQIVFSGPDLVGEVTVSATKAQYSASSIAKFDAQNATLLLFPWVPPSPGGGGGGQGLPLATLRGRVLDIDKTMAIAPNNCFKPVTGGTTCDLCELDADCNPAPPPADGEGDEGAGGGVDDPPPLPPQTHVCAQTGAVARRCFRSCETTNDCENNDFVCVTDAFEPDRKVCKPSLGLRTVACTTSLRSTGSTNPPPAGTDDPAKAPIVLEGFGETLWVPVDLQTGEYELSARLDELAVVCVGGYISNDTAAFEPTAMGVRRHVFPQPAEILDGLDVRLTVPLLRRLPVRLDHPPRYFNSVAGTLLLEPWLELGSDGFAPLYRIARAGFSGQSGVVDELELPYQPLSLPVELTDVTFTYDARAEFGGPWPVSATRHDDLVRPGNDNVRLRRSNGSLEDDAFGAAVRFTAVVAEDSGQGLMLAHDGRLYGGALSSPSLVWAPEVIDPYAVPVASLAMAGTPTDATIVGALGLIRRFSDWQMTQETGAIADDLLDVCMVPAGRVAVSADGRAQANTGEGWQLVPGVQAPAALRGVACRGTKAVVVGDLGAAWVIDLAGDALSATAWPAGTDVDLHDVAFDEQGRLWVAGGQNSSGPTPNTAVLLERTASGWADAWPQGDTPAHTVPTLTAVVPLGDAAVALADDEGGMHRADPAGYAFEGPERPGMRIADGVRLANGDVRWVGEPGLWLGPFLAIADDIQPAGVGASLPITLAWQTAPGPEPSATRLHLDGNGFPFWWLYVAPEVQAVALPDFAALQAGGPLLDTPDIGYTLRIDRVYEPGLSIDGFSTFDLEFGGWRSWSTNVQAFSF